MGHDGEIFEDFGAFYRLHLDRVLAFCAHRTGEPELAADVAAEVFAAALIARRRYRPDRGAPETWLLGIAAHKLADAQRRGHVERRAQARLGIAPIEWTDEDLARVSALGDGRPVAALLQELPGDQRAAVQARIVEERSYEDVASQLGVSEATARKRVSRGLATLRARVSKEEER
ncbi:MAG TPA: RNA polymerase sigma factor [Solirubrobacteraceae bacterium]